jgi:hypothetical protein
MTTTTAAPRAADPSRSTEPRDPSRGTASTLTMTVPENGADHDGRHADSRQARAPRPPERAADRDRWRAALAVHLDRKARTRALRAELVAARDLAKRRRHADRLARNSATQRTPR